MKKYLFIVSKENQSFVSIIEQNENEISSVGVNLDLFSGLITDEETARLNFTATGHLPSEEFETMLEEAKGL